MPRRPVTPRVRAASRHNIRKAQVSRYRIREPRSLGRVRGIRRVPGTRFRQVMRQRGR